MDHKLDRVIEMEELTHEKLKEMSIELRALPGKVQQSLKALEANMKKQSQDMQKASCVGVQFFW